MTNFKERFKPATSVKYSADIIPSVTISDVALQKMYIYTDEVKDEVGWLGTATRNEESVIKIHDVYLFKQQVHGATTEITPEGLEEFATELLSQPNGLDIWNNMKMWGHSHVNMGITPSGQDDKQMEDFSKIGHDFFVRLICNKNGEMGIDVYDYEAGFEFHNVPWSKEVSESYSPIEEEILELQLQLEALEKQAEEEAKAEIDAIREPIKAEIAEKVKKFTYTAPKITPSYYNQGQGQPVYGNAPSYTSAGSKYQQNKTLWSNIDKIDGVSGTIYDYFTQKELVQVAYYCQTYEDFIDEMYADGHNVLLSKKDIDLVWNEVCRLQTMSDTYYGWGGY